ncbi:MAG: hypothetical protein IANPNBLG_01155 [Bryobacteraceae bacterium]|nr:hypothetical protein [Bryobacteraceae bacterium]
MSGLKQYLAIGTGAGIELAPDAMRVAISRVRPGGVDVTAAFTIAGYHERPAAEWGAEYASLLRKHGAGHLAAAVLLPRREVIVRVLTLPGVAARDMEAAIRLQIDTLHPYADTDAAWTWARLGGSAVLIAIARQSYIERQAELLAEAGIKVSSFTFSAAAIHGALRLHGAPPREGFLGLHQSGSSIEAYGESPAKPIYSAIHENSAERAAAVSAAELRLPDDVSPRELAAILPSPRRAPEAGGEDYTLAYLASLAAACPRFALPVNLLPSAQRSSSSRLIYAPTLALGALLALALAALGFYHRYEDRRYIDALNAEIKLLEPRAKLLAQLDRRIAQARERISLLDQFQSRTKSDLDALREATRVITAPAWLNTLELSRTGLVVAGESDQATGLLKALDSSPQFRNSEFVIPISRVGNVEVFRIRAAREGAAQ